MGYVGQHLQMVIYQLLTRPEEIEVTLGTNGSANRSERGGWIERGRYELPGNPNDYIDRLFGERSPVRPLIQKPHRNSNHLYVGTDVRRGIQFTIPTSAEQAFIQIVESMSSKKEFL